MKNRAGAWVPTLGIRNQPVEEEVIMKIRINKDVVEFTPEHAAEAAELEALWVKMGNCVGGTKALSPIGVYVPSQNKTEIGRAHV